MIQEEEVNIEMLNLKKKVKNMKNMMIEIEIDI